MYQFTMYQFTIYQYVHKFSDSNSGAFGSPLKLVHTTKFKIYG